MTRFSWHLRPGPAVNWALVAAGAACLTLYLHIRPALSQDNELKPTRTIACKARETARRSPAVAESWPYPPNAFPGARHVETEYGTIKVFEWGPEDGEKVLLMHGIGTPCVALGDMAKEFVRRGCRVILFDFFGRGYSDAPVDVLYDDRLYTTQILLVIASSALPWTGSSAFHLLGYSLGGALAASFAAHHPHLVRSLTLVCPGGLVRPSHVSFKSWLLYSHGILPTFLVDALARRRLQPRRGVSADVPEGENAGVDFDDVPVSRERKDVKVGDVVGWQLQGNTGFVGAYMSTMRHAPIYGQHDKVWKLLGQQLARRRPQTLARGSTVPAGLTGGKICLILAERDPIIVKEEWIEDSKAVLGEDGVDIHVVNGGHEIAISRGKEVADIAVRSWR
ncbi:alpha/beta hydrolase fold domain-containing protein [Hirsutella rhossiliensis]|uniref:Alpha/beta hydrolase fold domain-containing protein n=1 Tax=Hirsutella rhossiliensis TaxID=111463 RepID=A0A9P8N7J2_9HYPO|nr:alpha/beta hydrolase fold domain-containing protein [Hirsutella rhossiliensis]KAH0968275.1 alpha/beta hydrolase fold domain-containing protein [Hirsutella rhossiliensis]